MKKRGPGQAARDNLAVVTNHPQDPPTQRGLLDLSVDLSVPEVYSGTDFTVYLHIKNPFSVPAWIDAVELSLPTQLLHKGAAHQRRRNLKKQEAARRKRANVERTIADREKEIHSLQERLGKIPASQEESTRHALGDQIERLEDLNDRARRAISSAVNITAEDNAVITFDGQPDILNVTALKSARVHLTIADTGERVQLTGSLPKGSALEPGCTDVWTIRLGTKRSPFFIPAKYRLQLTVVYAFEAQGLHSGGDGADVQSSQPRRRKTFSNTTSLAIPVRAALWNVMLGGVLGGIVGSMGRSLQSAKTVSHLTAQPGVAVTSLLLSMILSWAAIIFSARKSEAQSFVTVEDLWGGLLIGFLIGYSGTAAFTNITGVKT